MYEGRTVPQPPAAETWHAREAPNFFRLWRCLGEMAAFGTPESGAAWLRETPYEDFRQSIVNLNAHLRGVIPDGHDFARLEMGMSRPGPHGQRITYLGAKPDTRDGLLAYARTEACNMRQPQEIGEMFVSVLLLMQAFEGANKRTARYAYGLAVPGYDGSPEAKRRFAAAVDDREPSMSIDFGGLLVTLASTYGAWAAEQALADLPDWLQPQRPITGIRAIGRPVRQVPRLGEEAVSYLTTLLNEPYFGLPFLIRMARRRVESPDEYQLENGTVSASRFLRSLGPIDVYEALEVAKEIKTDFIRSVIHGYARRSGPLANIRELTEGCWPVR